MLALGKEKIEFTSSSEVLQKQQNRDRIALTGMSALLLTFIFLGIAWGPLTVSFREMLDVSLNPSAHPALHSLIFQLRLPRVVLAIISGGALACSGAALQALFNNPLAEPGLIGISSGAMLSIVAGIVVLPLFPGLAFLIEEFSIFSFPVLAFLGALGSGLLVYIIASYKGRVDVATMLLGGVAVNAFCGAMAGFFIFISDNEQLRTITFWTMGSIGGANWLSLLPVAMLSLMGVAFLIKNSAEIECLALGERQAAFVGLDVDKVKKLVFLMTALAAGSTIALTGIVGFVGLVVPHIVRQMTKLKMRSFLMACFLCGASFQLMADTMSKNLMPPSEVPLGIITSAIGTPYFVYLLTRRKRQHA